MENSKPAKLTIDWKKHEYPLREKITKQGKEKVAEALKFGKMVEVNHYNHKTKTMTKNQLSFYANNTLVYVAKSGCPKKNHGHIDRFGSTNDWVYEIQGVHFLKESSVPESVSISKVVEYSNDNHVKQRLDGRAISLVEIYHTLKNGLFVADHKVNRNGYVYYDRYYFCNDVCVLARETKNKTIISTVYRITPVGDTDFLTKVGRFKEGLINHDSDSRKIDFGIKSKTAEEKWMQSDEYWDQVMLEHIKSGNANFDNIPGLKKRIRFLNMYQMYHKSEQGKRYLETTIPAGLWMKLAEFGGVPYLHNGNQISFKDFQPIPGHEYSFVISIDSPKDILTKRQVRHLQLLGFDPEKYPHSRKHENNVLKLEFSMSNFSVKSDPWAYNNWKQEKKHGA